MKVHLLALLLVWFGTLVNNVISEEDPYREYKLQFCLSHPVPHHDEESLKVAREIQWGYCHKMFGPKS